MRIKGVPSPGARQVRNGVDLYERIRGAVALRRLLRRFSELMARRFRGLAAARVVLRRFRLISG